MTQFIALMAGAYLSATGLGFLVSTRFYTRMVAGSATTDPVTLNLSGAAHFLVGLSVLLTHFHWDGLTEAVVTLLGLAALIKGLLLIVVPEVTLKSPKASPTSMRVSGVGFVIVGAYLGISALIALS